MPFKQLMRTDAAPVIRNIIAPLWAMRERSPYLRISETLRESERMDSGERLEKQWAKLKKIVHHAWSTCPFYRKRFEESGINPHDIKDWSDFRKLPILTKQDIRENVETLISSRAVRSLLIPRKTSGSTGVSLNFFTSEADYQYKRGTVLYRDQWAGWRLGEWKAMVWGNPEYLYSLRGRIRNTLLDRCFSLDTLKMDEQMMEDFCREILRRRPTLLFGHAHSLYLFARYWRESQKPSYQFGGIISTAMVLHAHERAECEEIFHTRVFDRYGCEEVSLIASECEAHSGLHLNTDNLVIEILTDGKSTNTGEAGDVVVSDLDNKAMPIIRYVIGDRAVVGDGMCSCGRTYPLIARVDGRIADYLRTPEGHWVSGISLTENFATLIPGLQQIQIIQEEPDLLNLRVAKGPDFADQSLRKMKDMIRQRFGSNMRFQIEWVDRILPETSGKYRFTIYKVNSTVNGI